MAEGDLFIAAGLHVRPISPGDISSTLAVYEQCEDFLSLGPVAKASLRMLQDDIRHSRDAHGRFCGVWNETGTQVGVLDFVPEIRPGTACLALLMVSLVHRGRGYGTAILLGLERYLQARHGTEVLTSGVQVNNGLGIRFWRKRGFCIGQEARDMGDGTVAFEMEKRIGAPGGA